MKKLIALALALVMVLAFAACTKAPAEDSGKKQIVMGTNAAFPPYEFVNDDGSFGGIDVDIAKAIADKLGYELVIKDMEFDSLIAAVDGGSIDFAMAGMTVTDERKESVNFSETYAKGVQVIIVKEGSDIKTADDLEGKTIGVQSGTTGDIYCTDDFGQENVKQFKTGAEAVAALKNDQVQCVVIDNEPAKNFVAANTDLVILDTSYADEDYAAAIAKTNDAFLADFNKALAELQADGTIDKIVATYIK
ncbi:MAG: transporter substrate-binding domain-containing protein [Clostridia bacterium]|nr:transporter substrate-binding domain-containing protein [Clostridia bacterium]